MSEIESKSTPKVTVNPKLFWSRIHTLFDAWKKGGKSWGASPAQGASKEVKIVDALCFPYGAGDEEDDYAKSLMLQFHLFGYEINEMVIVLTREPDMIYILTTEKKGNETNKQTNKPT
jgi:nucleosome binding factor SPN SPT16 subunit